MPQASEQAVVAPGIGLALGSPVVEVLEPGQHHRGLERVEPGVAVRALVAALGVGSVNGKDLQPGGLLAVIGHNHAALAEPAE
jgi:hypothetical protein